MPTIQQLVRSRRIQIKKKSYSVCTVFMMRLVKRQIGTRHAILQLIRVQLW